MKTGYVRRIHRTGTYQRSREDSHRKREKKEVTYGTHLIFRSQRIREDDDGAHHFETRTGEHQSRDMIRDNETLGDHKHLEHARDLRYLLHRRDPQIEAEHRGSIVYRDGRFRHRYGDAGMR